MLIIGRAQSQVLEVSERSWFEDQMTAHAQEFSPRLHRIIGDGQMRRAMRSGIDEAIKIGFTRRGPVQLYLDVILLFGSGVRTDPQYPWFVEILGAGNAADQISRAERLHHQVVKYLDRAQGAGNEHVYRALRRLCQMSIQDIRGYGGSVEDKVLAFLATVHPEKCSYTDRSALDLLVREAIAKTVAYTGQNDLAHVALVAALMFSFGHACDRDPFYPWIEKTLTRLPGAGIPDRMNVLERQARLWMRAVLRSEGMDLS